MKRTEENKSWNIEPVFGFVASIVFLFKEIKKNHFSFREFMIRQL